MKQKTLFTLVASLVLLGAVLIGVQNHRNQTAANVGGFLVATVTNTSSTVGMLDTIVKTPANYQFFYAKNTGAGNADCAWSTTTSTLAVVGTGMRFDAATLATSTAQEHSITDPNLLSKYLHCIANTTTTLTILKY